MILELGCSHCRSDKKDIKGVRYDSPCKTVPPFKGQIKAKDIFINVDNLRSGDFKSSNEIMMRVPELIEIAR